MMERFTKFLSFLCFYLWIVIVASTLIINCITET